MISSAIKYQDIIRQRLNYLSDTVEGYQDMQQAYFNLSNGKKDKNYRRSMLKESERLEESERKLSEEKIDLINKNKVVYKFFDHLVDT